MAGMFDSVFEYLFKYPQIAYERGEIVWGGAWSPLVLLLLLGFGAVLVVWSYVATRNQASLLATWTLVLIRATGLAVLTICLLRPTLVLSTAVPQQNVVAIVIDDSRSMMIPDQGDRERGVVAQDFFASPESPLLEELEARFLLRHFRFSSQTERLRDSEELAFDGTRTLLGSSLDFVRSELASLPLSSIVLVTDGGDQAPEAMEEALLAIRAEGIPVHVVGAGRERVSPEIVIERVELPRSVARGSAVMAQVIVAHTGLNGARVPVHIEEDGRILASQEVVLEGGSGSTTVRIPITLETPGVRSLTARVPGQTGEVLQENNAMDAHIQVRDGRDKILYYEGQPRHEVAFMRRAVRDDQNLQLVVLQRTGEDRYVRLDVDSGDELAGGFPSSREELFEYRGLILGSVEASSFSPDQIRMIVDFVDRRGGGLLALGGPRAFAEGGYAGTALDPIFPLELDPAVARPRGEVGDFWATMRIAPTRSGLQHPALLLAGPPTDGASNTPLTESDTERMERWEALPELTTVNALGTPKRGATVLLTGSSSDLPGGEQPVLAFQRYGAGVSAVLGVHDTWLWQMHADIPLEDETHELFWRQLLRWLVQDVSDPLQANATRTRVAPGEAVELVARVMSEEFLPVNNAVVTARVTDPFGSEQEVALTWDLDRDGEYRGSFLPGPDGPYEVQVEAVDGERTLGAPPLHIQAGVLDDELRSGAMRGNLLRRIATETGGQYYPLDRTDGLAEDLRYTERGTVVQEERDLWDLPVFFFLLVGLLSAEWLFRRGMGLA